MISTGEYVFLELEISLETSSTLVGWKLERVGGVVGGRILFTSGDWVGMEDLILSILDKKNSENWSGDREVFY